MVGKKALIEKVLHRLVHYVSVYQAVAILCARFGRKPHQLCAFLLGSHPHRAVSGRPEGLRVGHHGRRTSIGCQPELHPGGLNNSCCPQTFLLVTFVVTNLCISVFSSLFLLYCTDISESKNIDVVHNLLSHQLLPVIHISLFPEGQNRKDVQVFVFELSWLSDMLHCLKMFCFFVFSCKIKMWGFLNKMSTLKLLLLTCFIGFSHQVSVVKH